MQSAAQHFASRAAQRILLAAGLALCALAGRAAAPAAPAAEGDTLQLEVRPRICTLSARDDQCDTVIEAQWRSPRDESLCLVIVGRPDIKRCWESFSEGVYTVRLAFRDDLVVELRDSQLQGVLASAAITVIREAQQLRRKRRQPWNIFN
jgi:Protein of unknown function (DUF3019)